MKINKQLISKYLFKSSSLTIISLLLFILGVFLLRQYDEYYTKKENNEYKKDIVDIYTKLDGYVVDYSWSKVYAGTKLATLSTDDKFFVGTVPYDRKGYSLFDCLDEGDHLYKPANTDSIFVTKPDGKKFFFMAYWKQGSN